MDPREKGLEKKISYLEQEGEELSQELTIAEKKAALADAKRRYGRDWRKILGLVKSLKVDRETMQTLHSMGGGNTLRDLNDPRTFGRRKKGAFEE